MNIDIEQVTYKDYSSCSPHFVNGVEFLRRGMVRQAAHSFEMAYEQVRYHDTRYNKYASYCGYTRVLMGDRGGLALCREVARSELYDGDVFYNLAQLEWRLNDRKKAIEALTKGIDLDEAHAGLLEFRTLLGVRTRQPISFLPRNNVLNNRLGRLFRK